MGQETEYTPILNEEITFGKIPHLESEDGNVALSV